MHHHGLTNRCVHCGSNSQVLLHAFAPKVEVAVLQTEVLVDAVGTRVDGERRGQRGAEYFDLAFADFDLASRQRWVDRSFRPGAYYSGDANDVLRPHVDIVVDDTLRNAGVVTDVEKRKMLSVLPAPTHPTCERNGLPDVFGSKLTALVCAHGSRSHDAHL